MWGQSGMEVGTSTGNSRDHIKDLCMVVLTCPAPHSPSSQLTSDLLPTKARKPRSKLAEELREP